MKVLNPIRIQNVYLLQLGSIIFSQIMQDICGSRSANGLSPLSFTYSLYSSSLTLENPHFPNVLADAIPVVSAVMNLTFNFFVRSSVHFIIFIEIPFPECWGATHTILRTIMESVPCFSSRFTS